ncbi:ThiF family adenylyltransferase [Petrimonas sulfuriphila]|jgi:molybdopterin/thiamine biosynthesis adenylyltransferase|uniref:HesA/MoeB/ThiF family protein n=1 Tax=Petrimonas sulfuriphila TaxID=285070 RepID=UPI000E818960|nr:ThiF family adenylyltransferase [Dysgonamonadaceae bacterium]HBC31161.1 thiamine biosynthesis protein ThiF [Clostridiales bacterium]
MKYSITIQSKHFETLKENLIRPDKKERVAFVICGRSIIKDVEERFLSKEVHFIPEDKLITSEYNQVSWHNKYFIDVLKKAEVKNLAIILIHNHPDGVNRFSEIDDDVEYHLFKLAFNRNVGANSHASLILLTEGNFVGRVWKHDLSTEPISMIRIIGDRIKLNYPNQTDEYESPEIFNRQQLAFGRSLIQDLSNLKISIIGAGATGSATALLLTRLGVGELCIIDKDTIEESNLNRLHGATILDVGKFKVDVLQKYIYNIGLGTKVNVVKEWVSNQKCIEQLKTSDIIFGCTDDHAGRIMLNRFAYFYLTPVFDMGLVISVKKHSLELENLQGRISYLFPGSDCLVTKGNINIDIAYSENLRRNEPENFIKLKDEAYVIGEGNPSPAVVTFTTQIATMAVNEFLNRIQGFNPQALNSQHKIFFFHHGIEIFPENVSENECRICGKSNYWGRGDMEPFLDMVI